MAFGGRRLGNVSIAVTLLAAAALTGVEPGATRSALASAACDAVPGNLVQNCGFEQPVVPDGSYTWVGAGSASITGWTVGSTSPANDGVDLVNQSLFGAFPVHSGSQSVDLDHDTRGSIYQDVATTAGQAYQLTFYLSGYPTGNCSVALVKTLTVTAGTTAQGYTFTPSATASPPGNQQFVLETLTFTGNAGATRLTFTSSVDDCAGPILDDVSVVPTTNSLPTGRIVGSVYANQASPGNAVDGAVVEACAGSTCAAATSAVDGSYTIEHLPAGTYAVSALPPLRPLLFPGNSVRVTVIDGGTAAGTDVLLYAPLPPPAGLTLPGAPTYANGVPVLYNRAPVVVQVVAPAGSTVSVTISDQAGTVLNQGPLSDLGPAPPGSTSPFMTAGKAASVRGRADSPQDSYGATFPPLYPSHGGAHFHFECSCSPPGGGGSGIDLNTPNDPSGSVLDQGGRPVPGATVTLYRADVASGPFTALPSGSAQLAWWSPTNPETTGTDGRYAWDVYPGYYKVRASAPNCTAPGDPALTYVESDVKAVPPAVTGLDLGLQCRYRTQLPLAVRGSRLGDLGRSPGSTR